MRVLNSPSPMIDAGEKILIASATSARLQACMCSNRDARPATGIGVGTTGSGSCRVSIAGTPGGACCRICKPVTTHGLLAQEMKSGLEQGYLIAQQHNQRLRGSRKAY